MMGGFIEQQTKQHFVAQKNIKHVHVLGLEGHMHDTNTSPKTNCATTIEENIIKATVEWNKATITMSADIL